MRRFAAALGFVVTAACARQPLTTATPLAGWPGGALALADGATLYYRTVGAGPDTVVVLHGGPSDLEYLAPDLEPLAEGRTLVFYDQRGLGRSTLTSDSARLTLDQSVADLDAVRRHFGLARVTLLGHSWGAVLAAAYAAAHPASVRRLVLVDPGPATDALAAASGREQAQRVGPAGEAALDSAFRTSLDARARCVRVRALLLSAYWADTARAARSRGRTCAASDAAMAARPAVADRLFRSLGVGAGYDLRPRLAGVTAPTLVVVGDRDWIVPASARAYAGALTDARVFVIPDAGHFAYAEQPAAFFPAVDAFLRGRWPPGAESVPPGPPAVPRTLPTPYRRRSR